MIDRLIAKLPEGWRDMIEMAMAPIAWVPRMQSALIDFFLDSSPGTAVLKYVFLLFPVLLLTVAVWCTQLSVYTLPFRAGRGRYVSLILLAWWDAALSVWLYWVGLVRFAGVAAGWLLALANLLVRLAGGLIRHIAGAPFTMTSAMTRSYFQSGFPWVAFVMLVFWCVLEAAVFSYTLTPTMTEVLSDMVGGEAPRFTTPILYMLLLMLIMGSFACVQALTDAVHKREMKFLVQIVLVELFVMFFEVMFLYRELVDSITPWVAQQTGVHMGIATTLSLAAFGWIGIRGMTWFLFGQYGTPPLLAFISRQPIAEAAEVNSPSRAAAPTAWWRPALEELKGELAWLHGRSDELLEYLALPVLHVLGAAINFALVLTTGRQAFALPFKGLKDVTERRETLTTTHLQPRKQGSL